MLHERRFITHDRSKNALRYMHTIVEVERYLLLAALRLYSSDFVVYDTLKGTVHGWRYDAVNKRWKSNPDVRSK